MSHLVSPAKKGEQIDRRGLTDLASDPPQEHTSASYILMIQGYKHYKHMLSQYEI